MKAAVFDRSLGPDLKTIQGLLKKPRSGAEDARRSSAPDPAFERDARVALARAAAALPQERVNPGLLVAAYALAKGVCPDVPDWEMRPEAVALGSAAAALHGRPVVVLAADAPAQKALADRIAPLARALAVPFSEWDAAASGEPPPPWAAGALVLSPLYAFAQWWLRLRMQGAIPPAARPLLLVADLDALVLDQVTVTVADIDTGPQAREDVATALRMARTLEIDTDAARDGEGGWRFTDGGEEKLEDEGEAAGGLWRVGAYRRDMISAALVALHDMAPGKHYTIRGQAIENIVGSPATGALSRLGVRAFLELKEGFPFGGVMQTLMRGRRLEILADIGDLAGPAVVLRTVAPELAGTLSLQPSLAAITRSWRDLRVTPFATTAKVMEAAAAALRDCRSKGERALVVGETPGMMKALEAALSDADIPYSVLDRAALLSGKTSIGGEAKEVWLIAPEVVVAVAGRSDTVPTTIILAGTFMNPAILYRVLETLAASSTTVRQAVHLFALDEPVFGLLPATDRLHLRIVRAFWPLWRQRGTALRFAEQARALGLRKHVRRYAMQRQAEQQLEASLAFTGMGPP